jgi:glycosyltransferase involved in cell wall biosynthesis
MKRELLHLTWDSPDNPWCGGGGAYRDYTIMGMLDGWERTIWSGKHPKGSVAPKGCVRRDMGTGLLGEMVSRRTWAVLASRRLRQALQANPRLLVSNSVSAWAPVPSALEFPERNLIVMHHIAGDEILRRLGPFGPSSLRYEQRVVREGKYYSLSNRATAELVRAANPNARIELIPIGFDPSPVAVPVGRGEREGVTIAFFGRLDHRMKGLDRLFEAFAKLAALDADIRLLVAGRADRSMDAWITAAMESHPARERIEVVRNPSDQDKYRILDRADIFCVPSRFEGWCIAAVEAQSRGLPVVATCTDGCRDSVSDGNTGILVSNQDGEVVDALVAAILELARSRELRLRLGEAAVPWANQFTWASATKATDAFLQEMRQNLSN